MIEKEGHEHLIPQRAINDISFSFFSFRALRNRYRRVSDRTALFLWFMVLGNGKAFSAFFPSVFQNFSPPPGGHPFPKSVGV
jgi:hypothetical protein